MGLEPLDWARVYPSLGGVGAGASEVSALWGSLCIGTILPTGAFMPDIQEKDAELVALWMLRRSGLSVVLRGDRITCFTAVVLEMAKGFRPESWAVLVKKAKGCAYGRCPNHEWETRYTGYCSEDCLADALADKILTNRIKLRGAGL